MNMNTYHFTAPTRLDFAGGPTDIEPFRSTEGGHVVNASLSVSAHASVAPREDSDITIISSDLGIEEHYPSINEMDIDGPLRLIKAAIHRVGPEQGLTVTTQNEAPHGSGLGASGSLAIALLNGLRHVKGEAPSSQQLVADALYVENVMLDNINGGQDQYAAAMGGFRSFSFSGDEVETRALDIHPDTVQELEDRSVLCFSGESHFSGKVLDQIIQEYLNGEVRTVTALRDMKSIAMDIGEALLSGELDEFGVLLQRAGRRQSEYHPAITPSEVVAIKNLAFSKGATGSKMAGAGGGGCVYFFCEPGRKEHVESSLLNRGVQVLPIHFTSTGVHAQIN